MKTILSGAILPQLSSNNANVIEYLQFPHTFFPHIDVKIMKVDGDQ